MNYRIEYSKPPKKLQKRKIPYQKTILFLLLAGIFLGGLLLRQKAEIPDETGSPAASLIGNLSDGMSAGEAVTAFCREIIEHADLEE